eukprot:m.251043 g.251043  ORF g.251043 m.251043 type:complete len:515 (-) comp17010_c0_seq1:69-1613(-)
MDHSITDGVHAESELSASPTHAWDHRVYALDSARPWNHQMYAVTSPAGPNMVDIDPSHDVRKTVYLKPTNHASLTSDTDSQATYAPSPALALDVLGSHRQRGPVLFMIFVLLIALAALAISILALYKVQTLSSDGASTPTIGSSQDTTVGLPTSSSTYGTSWTTYLSSSTASMTIAPSTTSTKTTSQAHAAQTTLAPTQACSGTAGPYVYVLGGKMGGIGLPSNITSNAVERYDPTTQRWSFVAHLGIPRIGLAAAILPARFPGEVPVIVATGGYNENALLINYASTEIFDPCSGNWSAGKPMNSGRNGHASTTFNSTVWVLGGWNNVFLATTEWFDRTAGAWRYGPQMTYERNGHASRVLNNTLYAIGGNNDGPDITATVECLAQDGSAWQLARSMNQGRSYFAAEVLGQFLYVAGGRYMAFQLNSVERYSPSSDTWTTLSTTMNFARSGFQSACVSGMMFIAGGTGNQFVSTALEATEAIVSLVEVFDANTSYWNYVPNMEMQLLYHAVVSL